MEQLELPLWTPESLAKELFDEQLHYRDDNTYYDINTLIRHIKAYGINGWAVALKPPYFILFEGRDVS